MTQNNTYRRQSYIIKSVLQVKIRKLSITRLEVVAFVAGMAILTFELVAARITSPYLGNTIYTWTSIIGVILAALAYGYYKGGILADKRKNQNDIVVLLCAAALLIALINLLKDSILAGLSVLDIPLQIRALIGSVFLFAFPTFLLGITMPYLARLSIRSVASSGRHLSRIDAASTIGSLVGTFMTGYFLFGLVGSRNLLSGVAVSLLLVSLLLSGRKFIRLQTVVLLAVLTCNFLASKPPINGYVGEIDTAYSKVMIRDAQHDGHDVRIMQIGSEGWQSGIYTDGTIGQPFIYIRNFAYASELRPGQGKYLIIGGGAFTFPEYLARKEPNSKIDTVEIDERLVSISRDYFNFKQPKNLQIIYDDGRSFLNKNDQEYDMIFFDAFNSLVPPFQLFTREAMNRANSSLTEDGIAVMNVISAVDSPKNKMLHHIYSTAKSEFNEVHVFQIDDYAPEVEQNLLLIASKIKLTQDELNKVATKNPEFAKTLNLKLEVPFRQNLILSDDFAPVEKAAR